MSARVVGAGHALPPPMSQQSLWDGFFKAQFDDHPVARKVWEHSGIQTRRGVADPTVDDVTRTFRSAERARPDVVFDCAGARLLDAVECAGADAKVVSAAYHHTTVPVDVRLGMAKEIDLVFASWYTVAEFTHTIAELRRDRLRVDHLVTDVITLDELPAAFVAMRQPSNHGKVLIRP